VLDYWLQHKKGADFLVLDRSVKSFHDKNTYSADEIMALTHWFGDIARQVRKKTDLPLWWAEYYATIPNGDPAAIAAVHASTLGHMIRSGTAAALLWQPMDTGEVGHALFHDARKSPPEGAQPHPLHAVYRAVHAHFGSGTPLVAVRSSSPDLEVLASPAHLLLVNKRSQSVAFGSMTARRLPWRVTRCGCLAQAPARRGARRQQNRDVASEQIRKALCPY
jgi:hypothetical protein